jgi:hypothetical protein
MEYVKLYTMIFTVVKLGGFNVFLVRGRIVW